MFFIYKFKKIQALLYLYFRAEISLFTSKIKYIELNNNIKTVAFINYFRKNDIFKAIIQNLFSLY